jgi:transcriptional regulator with XRE-family HTH domain
MMVVSELSFHPLRAYLSSALTNLGVQTDPVLQQNKRIQQMLRAEFQVELYLPQDHSNPNDPHSDDFSPEEVYVLDRWRVAESDFLLVSADHPSFGVGQEIELAGALGTPVIVFHQRSCRVSRMLKGTLSIFVPGANDPASPSGSIIAYDSDDDLLEHLRSQLGELISGLESARKFDSRFSNFAESLRQARESRSISQQTLAKKAGISTAFLQLVETGKEGPLRLIERAKLPKHEFDALHDIRFSNPGLWVIFRLADALEMDASALIGEGLPAEMQVEQFEDLCARRSVSFSEFRALSKKFEIGYQPRLLAASNNPLSEREFDRELGLLRNERR